MGNSKSLESSLQGCGNRQRTSASHSGGFYPHQGRCQIHSRSARISSHGIYPHENVQTPDPIFFHDIHGVNISVTEAGKVAARTNSFCYAIAFTSRPLGVEERINIKLKRVEKGWSGVMRFGFTSHDPAHQRPNELPRYACPDLTNEPGYWAKALPEKFARQDNLLTFYVNSHGSVLYSINDIEQGILFNGVNITVPVWVLVDVYGNTTSLEIINKKRGSTPAQALFAEETDGASSSIISLPPNMGQAVQEIFQLPEPVSPIGFSLTMGPSLHCRNRKLMSRKGNFESSLAFTNTALKAGETVYMYCAESKPNNSAFLESVGGFGIGITTCDPSTIHISELPLDSASLYDRPEYWIIFRDFEPPEEKEYFALTVEHEGFLSYKRQNHQNKVALFHMDISQPLHLVFDMHSKVSALAIIGMSSAPAPAEYYDAHPMSFSLEDNLELLGEGLSGRSAGRRVTYDDAYSSLNLIDDIIWNSNAPSRSNSVLPEAQGARSRTATSSTPGSRNVMSTSPASGGNSVPSMPSTIPAEVFHSEDSGEENEPGEAEPGEVNPSSNEGRRGLSMGELAGLSAPLMLGALSWLGNRVVNRISSNNNEMEVQVSATASSSSSNASGEMNIADEEDNDDFFVAPDMESSEGSDDSDIEDQLHTNARLLDILNSELGDLLPHLEMMGNLDSDNVSQTREADPPAERTQSTSASATEEKVETEQKDVKQSEECVICCDSKVNAVIYTCGHACMCYECGRKMLRQRRRKCPICRADIKDIIKIFHS